MLKGMINIINVTDLYNDRMLVEAIIINILKFFIFLKKLFCYTNLRSCGLVSIESSEVFENISNSKDISLFTDSDFLFAPNKLW